MYAMSTWYVGQAATLGIRIISWCITHKPSGIAGSRSEVLLSALSERNVLYLLSKLRKYEIIVPNYEYFAIKKVLGTGVVGIN